MAAAIIPSQIYAAEQIVELANPFKNDTFYKVLLISSLFLALLPFLIAYPLYLNNELNKDKNIRELVAIIHADSPLKLSAIRVLSTCVEMNVLREALFPSHASRIDKCLIAEAICKAYKDRTESILYQLGLKMLHEAGTVDLSENISILQGVVLPEMNPSIHKGLTGYIDPREVETFRTELEQSGFTQLDPAHLRVVVHPNFKGWILKGGSKCHPITSRAHVNLLRVIYAEELRKIVEKEQLSLLYIPQEGFVPTGIDSTELHDKYYVFTERLPILSEGETMQRIEALPKTEKEELARQICDLLIKSGYEDFSFDNFRLLEDGSKLIIIDTEPLDGPLYSEEDVEPRRPFNPNAGLNMFEKLVCSEFTPFSEETRQIFLDVIKK